MITVAAMNDTSAYLMNDHDYIDKIGGIFSLTSWESRDRAFHTIHTTPREMWRLCYNNQQILHNIKIVYKIVRIKRDKETYQS